MNLRIPRPILAAFLLAVAAPAVSQDKPQAVPSTTEAPTGFRRSDPALLSATGRPQLVKLFHPD